MGSIHLIQFPDKETRLRGLETFRGVPASRVRFPDDIFGVTNQHVDALKKRTFPSTTFQRNL